MEKQKNIYLIEYCEDIKTICARPKTEFETVNVTVEEVKTRVVPKCCSGYYKDTSTKKCLPKCSNLNCLQGSCDANYECQCESGFYGTKCDLSI